MDAGHLKYLKNVLSDELNWFGSTARWFAATVYEINWTTAILRTIYSPQFTQKTALTLLISKLYLYSLHSSRR